MHAMLSLECRYPVKPGKESFKSLLESLFVLSWNAYLADKTRNREETKSAKRETHL
jgi:hypothetical protein